MSNDTAETTNDKGRIALEAVEAAAKALESVCVEHGCKLGVVIIESPIPSHRPIVWTGDGINLEHALGLCQGTGLRFAERIAAREREAQAELDAGLDALRATVDKLKEQVRAHTVALQADAK